MKPVFVLSYPRCRTAWLATYLTGAGVFAFHEAWKHVTDARGLRRLMEKKGPGPVVNVDCSNWFFMDVILTEFPEARFIEVSRAIPAIIEDLGMSYGYHDYRPLLEAYERATMKYGGIERLRVDFAAWTPEETRKMWAYIAGDRPLDEDWHTQMHGMLVQLTAQQIRHDIDAAAQKSFAHIDLAMAQ